MERAITDFQRERSGCRFRILLFLFAFILFPLIISGSVLAQDDTCIEVKTISSPGDTVIDIFDYYVYNGNSNNQTNQLNKNSGINEGHTLWFHTNTNEDNGLWNYWPGYEGGVTQGIVKPLLGNDGFPVLNCGGTVYQYRKEEVQGEHIYTDELECLQPNESLSYLFEVPDTYDGDFDPNDETLIEKDSRGRVSWRAYPDVDNIIAVDDGGHYYFNSQEYRAIMDRSTGQLEEPMCKHTTTDKQKYGFYPFSATGERPRTPNIDYSGWFFGVHMQTDFSIPADYMVLNKNGVYEPMVYNFIGDDDVWLYIDGILIGDIGGIHSRHNLSINFKTGEVFIKNTDKTSANTTISDVTVYDMIKKAYVDTYCGGEPMCEEAATALGKIQWDDENNPRTFAAGTYHTMDFFYLERGAGGSNMEMQYNLVSTYDFNAHKALHIGSHNEAERLTENQFRFRMTGLTCPDASPENAELEVMMPKYQVDKDVIWLANYEPASKTLNVSEDVPYPKTLIVGNSEDGNINFGRIDLEGSIEETGSEYDQYVNETFCYIVEELPPEGAVIDCKGSFLWHNTEVFKVSNTECNYNFGGVIYNLTPDPVNPKNSPMPPAGAVFTGTYYYTKQVENPDGSSAAVTETVVRNSDGSYTFDDIDYDNSVYFYKGFATNQNYLSKKFYSDYTFSERLEDVFLADFANRYNFPEPVKLAAYKSYTSGGSSIPLEDDLFTFTLTDITGGAPVEVQADAGNDSNGKVAFDTITYSLKDHIPEGQTTATYTYKIGENRGDLISVDYSDAVYYARVFLTDTSETTGTASMRADVKYYRRHAGEPCPSSSVTFMDENGDLGCFDEVLKDNVVFRNTAKTLTVEKTIGGNIGSKNKTFEFEVILPEMAGKTARYTIKNGGPAAAVTFDDNGRAVFDSTTVFSLGHEGSITLYEVTGGFTVAETTESEYSTTYRINGSSPSEGRTAEGTISVEAEKIVYKNTLDVPTPTGIRDDLKPALIGLAAALMLLLTLWIGKGLEDGD